MAKTKTKVSDYCEIAKDLRPKDLLGLKGHGGEPKVLEQPQDEQRASILGRAFNWYNYFCSNKESKQFLTEYLIKKGEVALSKKIAKTPDSKVKPTYGWVARLASRGLVLTETEEDMLYQEATRLTTLDENSVSENIEETEKSPAEEATKKNVQIVMRERAQEVAGEIQGMVDEYIKTGCKSNTETTNKVVNYLSERNILPQHTSIVTAPLAEIKDELVELQSTNDEQLIEGYSHLTKGQVKNLIKYVDQLIANVNSYSTLKQTTKAKRVKKPVSVEKQVSKLKYLRKFKDEKMKLDLVSIEPTKLHNSSEAWCYDTSKRKLYHFVADEMSKCLIVKGNTLLGFDTKASEAKTLRKPSEQIKQIMGSKPAARKFFNDIKAVATTPNGRFNPNMIILRAF